MWYITTLFLFLLTCCQFSDLKAGDKPSRDLNSEKSIAYWITNPKIPRQKILLLGTTHSIPIDLLNPHLINTIKNADILIAEVYEKNLPQELGSIIYALLEHYPLHILHNRGFYNENGFMIEERFGNKRKSTLWTETTQIQQCRNSQFDPIAILENTIVKFYNQKGLRTSLEKFNPVFVEHIIKVARARYSYRFGPDFQLIRHFINEKKPIFGLETYEDREATGGLRIGAIEQWGGSYQEITPEMAVNLICENFLEFQKQQSNPDPEQITKDHPLYLNYIKGADPYDTRQLPETPPSAIRRNIEWLYQFISLINNPHLKNKSFAVVVGIGHIKGKDNFLQLLMNEGFSIKPYKNYQS